MSEQPFTPFPFVPAATGASAGTMPANDLPAMSKKRGGRRKPAASKAAKPARKAVRKVGKHPALAAGYGATKSAAPDLAINFVLSVLTGLSQAEQQTVAMLASMQEGSRDRVLAAVEKLLAATP